MKSHYGMLLKRRLIKYTVRVSACRDPVTLTFEPFIGGVARAMATLSDGDVSRGPAAVGAGDPQVRASNNG